MKHENKIKEEGRWEREGKEVMEERIVEFLKNENFSSAAECISTLENFREEHFGKPDSDKLLTNRLEAEESRSRVIFEELTVAKAALGAVLAFPDVRKALNLKEEKIPALIFPGIEDILKGRGAVPSESGTLK